MRRKINSILSLGENCYFNYFFVPFSPAHAYNINMHIDVKNNGHAAVNSQTVFTFPDWQGHKCPAQAWLTDAVKCFTVNEALQKAEQDPEQFPTAVRLHGKQTGFHLWPEAAVA